MKKCTPRSTQLLTLADYSRLRPSSNKYRNVPTEVDGIIFQSKKESERYGQLKLLSRAGKISNLDLQVKFPLRIEGVHVCNYIADFCYDDEQGNVIVEDCKGVRTKEYRLKAKLMLAVYRIKILET